MILIIEPRGQEMASSKLSDSQWLKIGGYVMLAGCIITGSGYKLARAFAVKTWEPRCESLGFRASEACLVIAFVGASGRQAWRRFNDDGGEE